MTVRTLIRKEMIIIYRMLKTPNLPKEEHDRIVSRIRMFQHLYPEVRKLADHLLKFADERKSIQNPQLEIQWS